MTARLIYANRFRWFMDECRVGTPHAIPIRPEKHGATTIQNLFGESCNGLHTDQNRLCQSKIAGGSVPLIRGE